MLHFAYVISVAHVPLWEYNRYENLEAHDKKLP